MLQVLQYSLNGTTYQNSNEFTDLSGGAYTIYVKDQNNCVITIPAFILEPEVFSVGGNISHVTCAGGNNGVIDLSVSGGTAGYDFSWSNGVTTEDNFNLTPGLYTVTATDAHGCSVIMGFTITEPAVPMIVNGTVTDVTTINNGSIDITVTGGVGEYSYVWSNNATTEDISGVGIGIYTVVVTDDNGCSASSTFVVTSSAGISTIETSNDVISIYPNPANDFVVIDANGFNINKVEVLDVLGQITFTTDVQGSKVQINTSSLEQGVYFVRIQSEGRIETKRLRIID